MKLTKQGSEKCSKVHLKTLIWKESVSHLENNYDKGCPGHTELLVSNDHESLV